MTTLIHLTLQYHSPSLSLTLSTLQIASSLYFTPYLVPYQILNENEDLYAKLKEVQEGSIDVLRHKELQHAFAPLHMYFLASMLLCEPQIKDAVTADVTQEAWNEMLRRIFEEHLVVQKGVIEETLAEVRKNTPLSASNQLELLFGTSEIEDDGVAAQQELWEQSDASLASEVVYPVPIAEIIEPFRKNRADAPAPLIKYIIIDCRSLKSYQFVRLPTAIHVGSKVGYEKEKIRRIIRRFEAAKGTHLALFGTGKNIAAEQHLLQLLAMQFVANGFARISMVKGGFMSAIKFISGGEIEYVRDEGVSKGAKKTSAASGDKSAASSTAQSTVTTTADVSAQIVGAKLKELWSWGVTKASEYRAVKSHAPIDQDTLHENSTAHNFDSKRPMAFELDDSDDESIDIDTMLIDEERADMGETVEDASNAITVELSELQKQLGNECDIYACTARLRTGEARRFLIFGRNVLMLLKPHPTELSKCVVLWHRSLRQVVRLSHNPKTNTLRFRLKGDVNQVLNADRNLQFNSEELRFDAKDNVVKKIETFMEELGRK